MKNDMKYVLSKGLVFCFLAVWVTGFLWSSVALATAPPLKVPVVPGEETPEYLSGIWRQSYMLGDMYGFRTWLSRYGISLGLAEISEVLGNVAGGTKRSFAYDGLTQMALQMDTQRAFDWYGGTFNVSALQIHGRDLSANNLLTLQTSSGITAVRSLRLWELWYQQKLDKTGIADVRIGQQSLDQEFMVTQNGLVFLNTMFGWPMLPSADMPGGGPAYPLSALGIRLRLHPPTTPWTFLIGLYNGSPVTGDGDEPQKLNRTGTVFPLNKGALAIAEVQYAYPSMGAMVAPDKKEPLPGIYRLGFWYDSLNFADQRIDNTGLSLADPNSSGLPRQHRGNYAFYGVVDQMIWQHRTKPGKNISFFARAMGTPQADRNLVNFSLNAGFVLREPFVQRDGDTFGIGMGYANVSSRAAALDRDANFFGQTNFATRRGETFVEVTYQYQITPWWYLQPDFQYIFNPGGGIPNPNSDTGQQVKNEVVIGVRTSINF